MLQQHAADQRPHRRPAMKKRAGKSAGKR